MRRGFPDRLDRRTVDCLALKFKSTPPKPEWLRIAALLQKTLEL
jgi:hypothetical protein